MDIRQGTAIVSGIVRGKIFIYKKTGIHVDKNAAKDPEHELKRFLSAKEMSVKELNLLYDKALKEEGENAAEIFKAHMLILEDPGLTGTVSDMIMNDSANAEYAVYSAGRQCERIFSCSENDYMKERTADIRDITERLIVNLGNIHKDPGNITEPVILFAEDLTPSETVQFDRRKILAFVTRKGSATSHTAILARMMDIPCVIDADIDLDKGLDGHDCIVDGDTGKIYIDSGEELARRLCEKSKEYKEKKERLLKLKGRQTVTKSGRVVHLYSNIGGPADVSAVLENDSEGIGLFRTEFLYMGRSDFPGEEEQFEIYKEIISRMNGKKVIIRTLDIGADKQEDYFNLPSEENPALGLRGIRVCLKRTDIFKTQLRAIYRASVFGKAAVMFPMIISVEEVRRIKEIVSGIKAELKEEGKTFGEAELGIMIETPAAAMIADLLAGEVDFFSIGTNDLTQYTLAADRQNRSLKDIFYPRHEAVLRMIEYTCKCAHEHGIRCGICGELGADMTLTERFVKMGIDELSLPPALTLKLREKICEME